MKKKKSNWQIDLQKTFTSALERAGIESGNYYLVGVSGGRDSVFLVHLLHLCGIHFCIAHLNHAARENANRDQQFVRSLASQMDVLFFTKNYDVHDFANRAKLSFEEAGRIARYQYLMKIAEDEECSGVIVGHHADDQVETVLMHLLRGSGIAGLSGMKRYEVNPEFSSRIPLLRPMLGIWRSEIEKYCTEEGLDYVEDETNTDVEIFRNRLRHSLIPDLESYNVNVRQHVWQTAMIAQQVEAIINTRLDQAWNDIVIDLTDGLVICDHGKYGSLEAGLQHAIIRKAFEVLLPTLRDFGYELTLKTQEMIENPPEGGQWEIMGEINGVIHKNELLFGTLTAIAEYQQRQWPQWDRAAKLAFHKGEHGIAMSNNFLIMVDELDRTAVENEPWKSSGKDEAWIDADCIEKPLLIRHFHRGDNFSPLGMPGKHRKISDYFIDQKIPTNVRLFYPLICDNIGILWVVGEQIDDRCKITDQSQKILRLRLVRQITD